MPGIRVVRPTGSGWEYSLDQVSWQSSPVFFEASPGVAFVIGALYTIYSRNLDEEQTAQESISFGQASSENQTVVTLQTALEGGAEAQIMPIFLGGIAAVLPDEPAGSGWPLLVVSPDNEIYARRPIVAQPTPKFTILGHFIEVPIYVPPVALPALFKASVDINNCTQVTGWVADLNHSDVPQFVRILIDNVEIGRATAKMARPDVQQGLVLQGYPTTSTVFGWSFDKPQTYRDGLPHTLSVFAGESQTEAIYYGNVQQTTTCAAPVDSTPYVVRLRINGPFALTKGSGEVKTWWVTEEMNDGTIREYAGSTPPTWTLTDSPAGATLTPHSPSQNRIDISLSADVSVSSLTLNASIGDRLAEPFTIQVLSNACTRPTTGLTTFKLSWHFIPSVGYARLYSTLQDANDTVGRFFDGSVTGDLDLFTMQAANLEVGTTVYYLTNTDCEKVSDNIYPVFDNVGGNSIKKAIQVVNGKIVAVLPSTYVTVINHPPVFTAQTFFLVGYENQPFSFSLPFQGSVQVSDPDGDTIVMDMEYSSDGGNSYGPLPGWCTCVNGVWAGTPPVTGSQIYYKMRTVARDQRGGVAYDPWNFIVSVPRT